MKDDKVLGRQETLRHEQHDSVMSDAERPTLALQQLAPS